MSILAPGDRQALLAEGLMGPADTPGLILLHKRCLSRYSYNHPDYVDLPLSPPSVAPEAYFIIPENLISMASLKNIGFNDETAEQIWARWVIKFPEGAPIAETEPVNGVSFLDAAIGFLADRKAELDTWSDEGETWIASMNKWGIDQELQNIIMDDVFKNMREEGSLSFGSAVSSRWLMGVCKKFKRPPY
ncbi:hypothetical protein MKX07_002861 [Trichoderma sp. CBMAI-0711]|nr:hypothetical protein MKX07_002861 [Trichoderma sp. CBMAI-0711]